MYTQKQPNKINYLVIKLKMETFVVGNDQWCEYVIMEPPNPCPNHFNIFKSQLLLFYSMQSVQHSGKNNLLMKFIKFVNIGYL